MPPSFNISSIIGNPNNGAEHAEDAEVSYTITAVWEASDGSDRALCVLPFFPQVMIQQLTQGFSVEAPIIFHPETDFDCSDGSSKPRAWLELPLRTDRSHVPFQCAVSLFPLSPSRFLCSLQQRSLCRILLCSRRTVKSHSLSCLRLSRDQGHCAARSLPTLPSPFHCCAR